MLALRPWAIFANLNIRDGARTDIMTSTRPPRGSVFLVEDEVMIRMMVADMLDELGYTVAAEAGEIDEAMRLAQTTYFDLAILDVNVNGKVIAFLRRVHHRGAFEADPEIGIAAAIAALVDLQKTDIPLALARHADARDVLGRASREIHIDDGVLGDSGGDHLAQHRRTECQRGVP